jgi:hypothetical protein
MGRVVTRAVFVRIVDVELTKIQEMCPRTIHFVEMALGKMSFRRLSVDEHEGLITTWALFNTDS